MTPQHRNSSLANQEFNWNGTDSQELYQKNLIKNRLSLERYKWIDRPITYKFNSHGFRADEFDSTKPGVMFLGCSHTLGVGLPYESTWAHKVSSSLRLKNYNLGVGGSSNDTAFRLAHYWIEQLKPKLVVFFSPDRSRFELHVDDDQLYDLGVWPIGFPMTDMFAKSWISNDNNSNMNYLKNVLAIKQLCSEHNIKYIQEQVQLINGIDQARDLLHFGEKTQRGIASMFLSKL
jgi:hypothetical protein